MKKLEKVLCIVAALVFVWLTVSFIEIVVKQDIETVELSRINAFAVIFDHNTYERDAIYNDNGTVITQDGNVYSYINPHLADGTSVVVTFDAHCTFFDKSDDTIARIEY